MEEQRLPPRLVIDTNIFVSGLISGAGSPARILRAVQSKRAVHLVSDPIVEEYLRVLDYPRIRKFRKVTDAFVADIAAYLVYQTERVELQSRIRMSPDPDDDVFLNTAVDGRATLLVSGDKTDLLALRKVEGIPIVSASDAIFRLEFWFVAISGVRRMFSPREKTMVPVPSVPAFGPAFGPRIWPSPHLAPHLAPEDFRQRRWAAAREAHTAGILVPTLSQRTRKNGAASSVAAQAWASRQSGGRSFGPHKPRPSG